MDFAALADGIVAWMLAKLDEGFDLLVGDRADCLADRVGHPAEHGDGPARDQEADPDEDADGVLAGIGPAVADEHGQGDAGQAGEHDPAPAVLRLVLEALVDGDDAVGEEEGQQYGGDRVQGEHRFGEHEGAGGDGDATEQELSEAAAEGLGLEAVEQQGHAGGDHQGGHYGGGGDAGEEGCGDGEDAQHDQEESGDRAEACIDAYRVGDEARQLRALVCVVACVVHGIAPVSLMISKLRVS